MDEVTKKHPGVVALEQRLTDLKRSLHYYERVAAPTSEEESLQRRIDELQEELGRVRVRRQYAVDQLALRAADIQRLEQLLEKARSDDLVAQLAWFKLLLNHNETVANRART